VRAKAIGEIMRKIVFSIFIILCSISANLAAVKSSNYESRAKKTIIGTLGVAALGDLVSHFSSTIREKIFGSNNIPARIQAIIQPIVDRTGKNIDIRQGRAGWSFIGDFFSYHNTLFVSKELCDNPEILEQQKDEFLPKIAFEVSRIVHDRDLKVTIACLTIPLAVYGGLTLYDYTVQRLANTKSKFYSWHKKFFQDNGFTTKSLIALMSTLAYIKLLDHRISH